MKKVDFYHSHNSKLCHILATPNQETMNTRRAFIRTLTFSSLVASYPLSTITPLLIGHNSSPFQNFNTLERHKGKHLIHSAIHKIMEEDLSGRITDDLLLNNEFAIREIINLNLNTLSFKNKYDKIVTITQEKNNIKIKITY